MGAELRKIEIGASLVTNVHALSELALAPESIEDDGIDGDSNGLDHDFDNTANESPFLHAANQSISNIVLEELAAFVVFAAPAPNVLSITVISTAVQDRGTDSPHDDAESEEEDGEDSVVDSSFFGAFVTSPPVGVENAKGKDQRDAGNGQQQDLWPWLGIGRPGGQAVSGGKRSGGIEDHKGSGNQGENDQGAGEVDATEHHLGHSDSGLDFLWGNQFWLETEEAVVEKLTRSLACSLSVSSSCFSRICSSLNVGLSGLSILPGVPGVFRADFSGGAFKFWFMVACCSTGSFEMYPKPTSDG